MGLLQSGVVLKDLNSGNLVNVDGFQILPLSYEIP